MLNLVDPSLYCGVRGVTGVLISTEALDSLPSTATAADHMKAIMFAPTMTPLMTTSSAFQWLPCEIDVDTAGLARVRTYINNLHPDTHRDLYETIGAVFTKFVPLFDQVLSTVASGSTEGGDFFEGNIGVNAKQRTMDKLRATYPDATRMLRRLVPPGLLDVSEPPRLTLKGSRCQVIVKMVEIVLTPDKPQYRGGKWFADLSEDEHVTAIGIHCIGCDNMSTLYLSSNVSVDDDQEEDTAASDEEETSDYFEFDSGEQSSLVRFQAGSVALLDGRSIALPNVYLQVAQPMRLVDPSRCGVYKFLIFFLVNPTQPRVASTATVPPQQRSWIETSPHPVVQEMGLPDAVVQHITTLSREGLSRADAGTNRELLLQERNPRLMFHFDPDGYV